MHLLKSERLISQHAIVDLAITDLNGYNDLIRLAYDEGHTFHMFFTAVETSPWTHSVKRCTSDMQFAPVHYYDACTPSLERRRKTTSHGVKGEHYQQRETALTADLKKQYDTCCVGRYWAGNPITLGLAEEILNGRAQKRAALLLLTHQL